MGSAVAVIYYGNPSTEAIRDAMIRGDLGCIITPDQGNTNYPAEWDTIADNGCFSGRWTATKWWSWLIDQPRTVRFAVAPDVFDRTGAPCHAETLDRWRKWGPKIARIGHTPAFVCQVGATVDNIPDDASVLFLGGTTKWKLGPDAWRITEKATSEGRWVHMGRVNSQKRLVTAMQMGCDSVDGTFLTFGPDLNLPKLLTYMRRARSIASQPELFAGIRALGDHR